MNTLLAVLVPLVDKAPDPADVKPGWLGFGVFLALARRRRAAVAEHAQAPAPGELRHPRPARRGPRRRAGRRPLGLRAAVLRPVLTLELRVHLVHVEARAPR